MAENNEETTTPDTKINGLAGGLGVIAFSFLVGVGFGAGRMAGTQIVRSINALSETIVIRRTKAKKDEKPETQTES